LRKTNEEFDFVLAAAFFSLLFFVALVAIVHEMMDLFYLVGSK
jgi:hypothetical protein